MRHRGVEAKRRSSRRHFDRWARSYESDPVARRLAALALSALDALALTPQDRLADVGCGAFAMVLAHAPWPRRASEPTLSLAWGCSERPTVHWLSTRRSGRRRN